MSGAGGVERAVGVVCASAGGRVGGGHIFYGMGVVVRSSPG